MMAGKGPEGERARLVDELRRLTWAINQHTAPEVATVPMALALDLAQLISTQSQAKGLEVFEPGIHNYYLAHGFYHAALEADPPDHEAAYAAARIIVRHADPLTRARFLRNHLEDLP